MVIPLALGLIVAGLLMCWLRGSVQGILSVVVYWTGIIVVILGLVLLLTPVIVWVRNQLVVMLGV